MNRKSWTDEMITEELTKISKGIGKMPSFSILREMGRNDLACQISKKGGCKKWSDKIGFKRDDSDSDTGWSGEIEVSEILNGLGFKCVRQDRVKWPFDLLVDDVLRIDVKSARYAEYGPCCGWFYRIGKAPQADVIVAYQLDTRDAYIIPWYHCPSSNITISRDGGKYAKYRNSFSVLNEMSSVRKSEMAALNFIK